MIDATEDIADTVAEGKPRPLRTLREAQQERGSRPIGTGTEWGPAARERKLFYTWQELKNLPPPPWLIPGKLPVGFSRIYGEPNVGKTFVALDMLLPLALKGERVIYIAGEGKPGIPKRVQAWLTEHGQPEAPLADFIVRDGAVNMLADSEVESFIKGVPDVPKVVCIDTVARCFGSGDENST